jgi:hypothetical protein
MPRCRNDRGATRGKPRRDVAQFISGFIELTCSEPLLETSCLPPAGHLRMSSLGVLTCTGRRSDHVGKRSLGLAEIAHAGSQNETGDNQGRQETGEVQ